MNTLTIDRQKEKRTFDYSIDLDFINALTFSNKDEADRFDQSKTEVSDIWDLNINMYNETINSNLFDLEKWINYSAYDKLKNINYDFFLNSYFALLTTEQKLSSYISYFNLLSSSYSNRDFYKYFEIINSSEINDFLKKYNIKSNEIIEIGKQIKHFFKEQIYKIYLIYRKDYEEDFENLFIKIKTTINFSESLEILNNFFKEYWFKKPKKFKKYINIFLSFD